MKTIVELAKAFLDGTTCIRVVDLEADKDTGAYVVKDVCEYPTTIAASYLAINVLDFDAERVIEFRDPLATADVFLTIHCDHSLTDVYLAQRGFSLLLLHHYGFTDNCGQITQGPGDPVVTAYRNSDPRENDNSTYSRVLEKHMRK